MRNKRYFMDEVYEKRIKAKEDGLTIFKSLNDNSDFVEAKNILKYQLSINLDVKDNVNLSHLIDDLYLQVDSLCSKYIYKIKKYINIDFNNPVWEFNELILRSSIKNHCIISALYTAKYLYLNEQNISIKELGQFSSNCGYWTLIDAVENLKQNSKRELPSQINSEELKNWLQKMWKPAKYKERSNFTNKFSKIVKNKDYKYIIKSLSTNDFNKIPLNDSDFTFSIMNYTKELEKKTNSKTYTYMESILKCISEQMPIVQGMPFKIDKYVKEIKDSNEASCIKFYKNFNEYIIDTSCEYNSDRLFICDGGYDVDDDISKSEGHSDAIKYVKIHTDNADRVLFNYKLERAFNKDLIDCVISEYESLTKKESSLFLGNSLNKVLDYCVLLPNSFSRTYFIKAILKNFNLPEFNELHNKLLDSEYKYHKFKNAIRFDDKGSNNEIDKSNKHINSFFDFIIHLSCITIPIYERTFFIMLYDYFDKKCSPISKKSKKIENSDCNYNKETLRQMLGKLHDYIKENAEYLMCDFDYNYGDNIYDEIKIFEKAHNSTKPFLLPGEAFFRSKNKYKYIDRIAQNSINIYKDINLNLNSSFYSEFISNIFTRKDIYKSNVIKFSRDIFIDDSKKMADRYIDNALMNAYKITSGIKID